jgi:hypothetical protein
MQALFRAKTYWLLALQGIHLVSQYNSPAHKPDDPVAITFRWDSRVRWNQRYHQQALRTAIWRRNISFSRINAR